MAEMEQGYIDSLIEKAQKAQKEFESYSQEQVDAIVKAMGKIIYDNAELIAKEAVEETGLWPCRQQDFEDHPLHDRRVALSA